MSFVKKDAVSFDEWGFVPLRALSRRELCETESVLLTFYRKKRNIMDKMLMQGKVAMVTGGGRGIGEASARRLADFGAKVILADLDLASATAVAESLKAEGKEAAAIEFNVADFDHITEKVAAARAIYGRIDVLVNVAGITGSTPITDITHESWDRMMDIDLKSLFFVSQAVFEVMKEQGYGKMVHMSSLAALRGGSLFGLKFMLNDVKKEVPFDEETFAHGGMRVIAVATNVETGKPAYFEKGKTDFPFDEAVRASASLPLASVPVVLDGQPYLDGGCSCPIALNWALNEGFEKIVVITTRQKGFRKAMPGQRMVDLYDDFYGDKPLFLADMLTQELRYNTLMDQLDSMKTAFRGYDKEATCELLQTLIRSMETEKKEEHRVLLQKNQRLVKEKEALTTQMAELLMKVDSLESENQRMMEQQNTMQKKYEELAEKLSRISENAIERETELSAYHLREQQMKEREATQVFVTTR